MISKTLDTGEHINKSTSSPHKKPEHFLIVGDKFMDLLANPNNVQVAASLRHEEGLKSAEIGFFPVPVRNLFFESRLPFDIFFPILQPAKNTVEMLKVLSKGEVHDTEKHRLLSARGITTVYVAEKSQPDFLGYYTDNLKQILSCPDVHSSEKRQLLYNDACDIVESAFTKEIKDLNISWGIRLARLVATYLSCNKIAPNDIMEVFVCDYRMANHCVQVALLGMAFCHYLDWSREEVAAFGVGAFFHDIGKGRIDDHILGKPSKLDDAEFSLIKQHPVYGHELLGKFDQMTENQLLMILQHHENMDGTGYPFGLTGSKIHLYARVARIIDSFDAITTHRPYKDALPPMEALEIMRTDGGAFDAELLGDFIKFLGLEKCLKEHAPCRQLSIELGTKLHLQFQGTEVRLKSQLVGMETGRYLITLLPSMPNLGDHLYKGNEVIVRYLCSGAIYGFRSSVLGYDVYPLRLLFLSYPEHIQCHDLRKFPRVYCGLPAKVIVHDKILVGLIVDISVGGCRFIAQIPEHSSIPDLPAEESLDLHFILLGDDAPRCFRGIVRNMRRDKTRLEIGVQFVELSDELGKKMEDNINNFRLLRS